MYYLRAWLESKQSSDLEPYNFFLYLLTYSTNGLFLMKLWRLSLLLLEVFNFYWF